MTRKALGSSLVRANRRRATWVILVAGCASAASTAGCTTVTADLNTGTVSVWTFLTSRQDVNIGRDADGSIRWTAKESNANADLAAALLNATSVAAKLAGAPAVP